MAALYELTSDYVKLVDKITDGLDENDDETIEIWNEINAGFEAKAENYAKAIKNLQAEQAALKTEEERLRGRRQSFENAEKRLKFALFSAMLATDKTKFKTPLFSFAIQNNPPSVCDYDRAAIPGKYWEPQEPKLDRAALLRDLKQGAVIDGAVLKHERGLRIR